VNVADQFKKVSIFIADNGFVSVLEKMTTAIVSMVEINRIPGQKASHEYRKRCPVAAKKEMGVISEHGPGKTVGAGFFKQGRKSIHKHATVVLVEDDLPLLDTAHNDMLQQSRYVNSGFSRHDG
jgi:hypothetical protein